MDQATHGSCHCGAVQLSVARPPTHVTECHCSICRRYAPLWSYYPVADVTISGPTETYVWGRKAVAFHRCATCGCVVGWQPRGAYPECGVNARMLEGFDLGTVSHIVEEDSSV